MHVGSLAWLAERLRDTPAGVRRTVVVTHHAPSHRSLSKDVRTDPLAPAYASALDDFVAQSGADLWIHGHTHIRCDYYLGNTRVISNPRGYKDEHTGFDPRCVVVTDDSHQGAGRFDLA
jgi:Icc-related predicted phosphoesterase